MKFRRLYHWNYLWLLLFAAGIGVFLIGMPKQVDDYRFMKYLKYWFDTQGILYPENGGNILTHGVPFKGVVDMMHDGWLNDNIRLSNFLATILLCFPKWVGSGLMLLLFMLSVLTGFRLAGVETSRSPLVPPALIMLAFMLPWNDNFGSFTFQINYILPAWLGMTLLWRLRPGAARTPLDTTLNILLAMAMGIAHEGTGIAFVCGLLALACLFRPWRRCDVFAAAIITLTGSLLLTFAPGVVTRLSNVVDHLSRHPDFLTDIYWIDFLIYDIPAYLIFIILTAVCLLIRRTRPHVKSPFIIFTIVSATSAIVIKVFCLAQSRMLFWPELLAIFGIMQLLLILSDRGLNRYYIATTAVNGLLLTLLFTDLAFTCYHTIQCRRTMKRLIEYKIARPDDNYFGKASMSEDVPAIGASRPGNLFATMSMISVNEYLFNNYETDKGLSWFIYPSALEHVTSDSGSDVSGGEGIRRVDNHFFMPYDPVFDALHQTGMIWDPVRTIGYVDFGNGLQPWSISFRKFRSNGDGNYYYWLIIDRNWYTTHFKSIREVRLNLL